MIIEETEINYDDIITTMRNLADEFPDNQPECMYVNEDDTPCCIVGHALVMAGVSTDWFQSGYVNDTPRNTRSFNAMDDVDQGDPRVNWINSVQSAQDSGHSWRRAVEGADENWDY